MTLPKPFQAQDAPDYYPSGAGNKSRPIETFVITRLAKKAFVTEDLMV
jgi:hypothetical protein